jgi:hypothetical protein
MLLRTDITGTKPLVQVSTQTFVTPVGDARQESFERFAHIELGKLLQAEIISRFDDGTFLVKVADTGARMNLPDGPKVGDSLPMTLIAREPRPTFLLGQQSSGATASLSAAGKFIGNLLQAAQQEGAPTSLIGKTALLPSSLMMEPAPLAAALQETLVNSGLFYESHVVQWASGERPRTELMREPQAKLDENTPDDPAPNALKPTPGASRASSSAAPAYDVAENGHLQIDRVTGTIVKAGVAASQDDASQMQPVLDKGTAQLINLQLDTLEKNRVAWQGELWPGQPLEWEVSEDTPKNETDHAEKPWQSVVRLVLPTLGSVAATIRLSGSDVQVQLRASSETAATALRAHGPELASALGGSGSRLDYLTVHRDES